MPYKILKGEMAKEDVTLEAIAELLGIHRNSAANKVNGSSSFSIEEASAVQEKFFPKKELKNLFSRCEEKGE